MQYLHKTISIILLSSITQIFAGFGCRENAIDTGGNAGMEFLAAEDVGVTDVYLRIRLPFSFTQQPVMLKRDTTIIFRTILNTQDTLVSDEHLLPNHTYTYTLSYHIGQNTTPDAHLTITTMDTTSHNFTWTIDTLGDGNSSVLYDVCLINDTMAFAVGEIYKKDSTGNYETEMYNTARWNGKEWILTKAYFYYNGNKYVTQLYSIFAFSENDIWVGTAGPYHWNGQSWQTYNMTGIFNGRVNKFWGTSSSNLYMVGTNGSITHYNGTSWEKMESGTNTNIMDAWGIVNPKTGKTEIYCPVTSYWTPGDKMILKITSPNAIDTIAWGTGRNIVSVWTWRGYPMFTAGDGVFENRNGTAWQEMSIGANIYTNRIRGTDINDVFVIGGFGLISHYNGVNFKLVRLDMINGGGYSGIAVNDHLIIAAGGDVSRAIVAIGKRY
jgi:hypothetical protein